MDVCCIDFSSRSYKLCSWKLTGIICQLSSAHIIIKGLLRFGNVISRNTDQMSKHVGSFDFILDAVSAGHDINAYTQLLRHDGNITLVGAPDKPLAAWDC